MYNTIYNNWLFSADNSQISVDSLSKCLKLMNLSNFFLIGERKCLEQTLQEKEWPLP